MLLYLYRSQTHQNQSISRIESMREDHDNGGHEDLLISDIQQNQSAHRGGMGENEEEEDLEKFLNTGAFTKEMMMGQSLKYLGSTDKKGDHDDFDNE